VKAREAIPESISGSDGNLFWAAAYDGVVEAVES